MQGGFDTWEEKWDLVKGKRDGKVGGRGTE